MKASRRGPRPCQNSAMRTGQVSRAALSVTRTLGTDAQASIRAYRGTDSRRLGHSEAAGSGRLPELPGVPGGRVPEMPQGAVVASGEDVNPSNRPGGDTGRCGDNTSQRLPRTPSGVVPAMPEHAISEIGRASCRERV